MFRSRSGREEVTCIACGEALPREDAREYDKHGDRWDRVDKEFEYLCKPCHRDLCHQPRAGLEALLVDIERDDPGREAFLAAYGDAIEEAAER